MNITASTEAVFLASDQDAHTRRRTYQIAVPMLTSICGVAILANAYVLLSIHWLTSRRKATLLVSLSLAAADCWSSVVMATVLILNSYLPVVTQRSLPQHECVAFVLESLRLGSLVTSVLHLLMLSILHYLTTAMPLFYRKAFTHRNTMALIAFLWTVPLLAFLTTFASVPSEGFQAPKCRSYETFMSFHFRLSIVVIMLLPLAVMVVFYTLLIRLLKRLQEQRHRPNHVQRKVRILATSLVIVGSFLLCWLPGAILYVLTCSACLLTYTKVNTLAMLVISVIANALIILKGVFNPVLYAVRIPEVRHAILRMHGVRHPLNFNSTASGLSFGTVNGPSDLTGGLESRSILPLELFRNIRRRTTIARRKQSKYFRKPAASRKNTAPSTVFRQASLTPIVQQNIKRQYSVHRLMSNATRYGGSEIGASPRLSHHLLASHQSLITQDSFAWRIHNRRSQVHGTGDTEKPISDYCDDSDGTVSLTNV